MKSEYKKFANTGPGGMRCLCCAPAPGKPRKQFLRAAKKAEKAIASRQMQKE